MKSLVIRVKKTSKYRILTGILFLCIFARYVFMAPIPRIAISGMVIAIACVATPKQLLALMISGIPFFSVIHNTILYLGCSVVYLVRFYRDVQIDAVAIVLVLFLWVWELLHGLFFTFSFMKYLNFIAPYSLLIIVMSVQEERLDYPYFVRYMTKCMVLMCAVYLAQILFTNGFSIEALLANMQRLGMNESYASVEGGVLNPNTLGFMCLFCSIGILQMYTLSQCRVEDIISMAFLLVMGIFTMSRTYLVCLVITVGLWIVAQKGTWKSKVSRVLALMLLLIVLNILMRWLAPEVIERFVTRFRMEDGMSGRDSLFIDYMEYIFKNPIVLFFGVGVVDLEYKLSGVSHNVPHNGFQEVVVAWGVLGAMAFAGILIYVLLNSRRMNKRQSFLNAIPLIMILVKVQVGQLVTMPFNITMIAMAYISLCWYSDYSKSLRVPVRGQVRCGCSEY